MWKLSSLIHADHAQAEVSPGVWVPARPLNEDFRTLKQRIKEAWAVFTGKASAFTWD
jgi:hypothetical protein